uniref:Uncharacterized protein n=1 Tax=Magallana gigas TaxID=29159 RepID=K1QJ17_MAGGI
MSAPIADFKESFNGNSPETVKSRKEYIKNHPDANLNDLIAYEKQKMGNEKKMMQANNVWEYRSSPPENWSAPLPEFIEARKDTHLNKVGDTWEKQDLRLTVRECLLTGELCLFPEPPANESSMRIPVKKTNVVASAREH